MGNITNRDNIGNFVSFWWSKILKFTYEFRRPKKQANLANLNEEYGKANFRYIKVYQNVGFLPI